MSNQYKLGLRRGLPICLGYIPVSFAFGMMAASGGMGILNAILMSATCFTSTGQIAGTELIIASAGFFEIAVTTFIINIRYAVMSLTLSQKLKAPVSLLKKVVISMGITDETFTLAMLNDEDVTFSFWLGLATLPYLGWITGTVLGSVATSLMPKTIQECLTIALYAMFIALVVPPSKRSKSVAIIVAISVIFSSIMRLTPVSAGFSIIIVSVLTACIGAILFPRRDVA